MFYAFPPYFNSKSRKAGKLDKADDPHIRNEKRQVSDVNYAGEKTVEPNVDNVDTESQHTSFSEETVSGPIQVSPTLEITVATVNSNASHSFLTFGVLHSVCRRRIKRQVVTKQSLPSRKMQQKK